MQPTENKQRRLRSFVCRNGRRTAGQDRAYQLHWPKIGLKTADGKVDFNKAFPQPANTILEIGFGTGQSLLALAQKSPEINILGVETHLPGIGAVCLGVEQHQLTNIRLYNEDVIDVLNLSIPEHSLHAVSIFFPDPWQKRRHHARRLVQVEFLQLLLTKLTDTGEIHLATDWDDYAKHMLQVVNSMPELNNLAGHNQFSVERSPLRPITTKFEARAIREGRKIYDLQLNMVRACEV